MVGDINALTESCDAMIRSHIGYTVLLMARTTITYGCGIGRMLKSYSTSFDVSKKARLPHYAMRSS
jgi:hypothetical protein